MVHQGRNRVRRNKQMIYGHQRSWDPKFLCCFYFSSPRTGWEEGCRAMFQLSQRLERPTEMPKRVLKIWQHKETAGRSAPTLIKTPSPKPPLHSLKQQLAPELINLRSVFSELKYLTKLGYEECMVKRNVIKPGKKKSSHSHFKKKWRKQLSSSLQP